MGSVFERAKAAVSRSFIETYFYHPKAWWEGDNYKTVSPLRTDGNPGSFAIRSDGVYYDYATGEGGDIVDLMAQSRGISPMQAAKEILGEHEESESIPQPAPSIQERPSPSKPWLYIPEGKLPQFRVQPDNLTLYSHDGKPAFYVARYNAGQDGKKVIFPMYWTGSEFVKGFPDTLKKSRPLYPVDVAKTVILVEGEAKRAAAEREYPEYSWTCWHGGASNLKHVDFSTLQGCDVIIWPDNDEVGHAAGDYAVTQLMHVATTVRRVVPPPGKDKGWDVHDAIKESGDIKGLLEEAIKIEYDPNKVEEGAIVDPHPTAGRAFTDLGNAERFCDMWGHVLRYNLDKNKWMVWVKGRWNDEDQTVITPMIKRTIRQIAMSDDRKGALYHAIKSEANRAISSMLSLAQRERGIPVKEDQLDQSPYYLNCPNGVVDLRTGNLMEPKQEWLITKTANTKYNPEADCPLFLRFLDETFEENPGLINFIQRWLGYSLTADTSAQVFAVFYGIGANGKSTLVELVQKIAGDYVKTAPPDTFIQKQNGGIPNDIAALRGSRMVLTTETEANAKLAEAKVKSMTGGDRVSARYMRGEFFEFTPTWKITISTNHRPKISGGDYGIWRRVVLVPFNNVVTPDRQDPLLQTKLLKEAEGIFNWLVKGAMLWYSSGQGRAGLQVPEIVYDETQEYREDEDVLGRFLSVACYKPDEVARMMNKRELIKDGTPAAQVFYSFRNWCQKEGEEGYARTTQNQFGRYMRERGYIATRMASGKYYPGVVPRQEWMRLGPDGYNQNGGE